MIAFLTEKYLSYHEFVATPPLTLFETSGINIGCGYGLSSTQRIAYSLSCCQKPMFFGQIMPRNDWTCAIDSSGFRPQHLNLRLRSDGRGLWSKSARILRKCILLSCVLLILLSRPWTSHRSGVKSPNTPRIWEFKNRPEPRRQPKMDEVCDTCPAPRPFHLSLFLLFASHHISIENRSNSTAAGFKIWTTVTWFYVALRGGRSVYVSRRQGKKILIGKKGREHLPSASSSLLCSIRRQVLLFSRQYRSICAY